MKTTKLFLLLAMMFLLSPNYAVPSKTYTKTQVDSIVAVEVQQQLDQAVTVEVQKQLAAKNAEIELLVEKSSQDKLGTYITEQNNQLTRQNTHFTILITVLMAIFGVGAPLLINWQNGKKWNGIAKENESIKSDIETMREQVEKLTKEAEESKDEARKAEQAAKISELFSRALKEKDVDKQIELYTEILKLSPDDVDALNNRGVAYGDKGDYGKAIENFDKAVKINPNDADLYINLGNAYNNNGDHNKAIENFDKAIKISPDDADAYYNRSLSYTYKNDLENALNDINQSIEFNPNDKDSRLGLEIIKKLLIIKELIEKRDFGKALQITREAMEIAKKTNDIDDDWVKIIVLKIKEIEDLQKQSKP